MQFNKPVKGLVAAALIAHLSACGTILYPERKGQIDGQINAGVAALNGIGLLFYLVPGVIAFAVDFSNGTIYLPNSAATEGEDDGMRIVHASGQLNEDEIARLVAEETGNYVDMSDAELRDLRMANEAAIATYLKQQQVAAR